MKSLPGLLALILIASTAQARTFWVSPSGNNSNPCTDTTTPQTSGAKLTIVAGIACLAGGDTLRLRAGVYNPPDGVGCCGGLDGSRIPSGRDSAHRTTIISHDGPGAAIIRPNLCTGASVLGWPNSGSYQNYTFDGIVFDGFNCVTPIGGGGGQAIYLGPPVQNIQFLNSSVIRAGLSNTNTGETTHGVVVTGAQHVLFKGTGGENSTCQFVDNGRGQNNAGSGNIAAGYHYYIATGNDFIIDGCVHSGSGGYGVHNFGGATNVIVRNSIFKNTGMTTGAMAYQPFAWPTRAHRPITT